MKTKITTAALLAVLSIRASAVVNIDYVTVGNVGNAADTTVMTTDGTTGYGSVAYSYQIAKNETTISQYAEFLNAVAKTDSYGLYSTNMTESWINGVSRSGTSGSYTYAVNPGSENKPITNVSWFDAARFCNWLHNGQQTGEGAALTAEIGAYTLNGATSGIVSKNVNATVWIPSENEWYKAAYYDPSKNAGAGGYWLHANQSDTMTTNDIGVAGAANYLDANGYAVYTGSGAGTWSITDVGAYGANSDSYYGTNDQAGNVWEWNDAVIIDEEFLPFPLRGARGESFGSPYGDDLPSTYRNYDDPNAQTNSVGFRVAAAIPEPTTGLLAVLGLFPLISRRRKA